MGEPGGGKTPFRGGWTGGHKGDLHPACVIFTTTPIFKSFSLIEPPVAAANWVWASSLSD
jgi:hypothetical protein